jgi:threonine/homoserine/homoserine lactone efflux protein
MLAISNGLRYGPRRTLASIFGILSANAFYFVVSASSLGALLLSSYNLFFLVKWVGAAYLLYMGVASLFARGSMLSVSQRQGAPRSTVRLFVDGFVLQISNPKALLWFGAIVPPFIDARQPVGPQLLQLGVVGITLEFPVLLGYAALAGRAVKLPPQYARWTNRAAGVFLIAAAAALALLNRD